MRLTILLAGLVFSASAIAGPSYGYRVLHHEAVEVATRKGAGASEHLSFDAYGRRFEVTLAPNERIRGGMPANLAASTVPMAGTVDGLAGSWVRITRSASGLRGMLFDGHDMYAIEPATEVAPVSVEPMNAANGTVVYRLSDALMPVETMRCELAKPDSTPESPATAADALQQLTSELHVFQAQPETAAATAVKQVRVGVVGDFEFVNQFTAPSTPEDAIVARMNIVDGIFTSQLGVKVALATPTLFRGPTDNDPFTTTVPGDLLTQLKNYRVSSPAQQAVGITHLMTGRNLDGSTVGIAYIKGLCSAEFGASLSQGTFNSTTEAALIAAHEIGHNFGAPHDGESGSACESTPLTFLMAPQLNGSQTFSQCSLDQIAPVMAKASCLTAYTPGDVSIQVTNSQLQATVGTARVASFTVNAAGGDTSTNVTATVTLSQSISFQSVTANGGTCTTNGSTANCNLGSLSTGDVRQIDVSVTPTQVGDLTLSLSVASSNDSNTANNSGTITLTATAASTPAPPATQPSSNSGGGGGGGSMDFFVLAALGGTLLLRRKRR